MIESTNLKMLRNLEAFQVFSDILASGGRVGGRTPARSV